MARERIEQEAVPAVEVWKDTLQRVDRVLKQWPRGAGVVASIGLIAAISTASQVRREGVVELPSISPVEGKETTLDISAAQIPPQPEIAVPREAEKAPVDIERFRAQVEPPKTSIIPAEKAPETKEIITSLTYTVHSGDTLSEIIQRFGATQEEILAHNKIEDPSLIYPGKELVIPEISVEKTVEFLQSLEEKVEEIYSRRRMWVEEKTYTVREGDSLASIGQRIGRTPDEIFEKNYRQIRDPNLIFPGQELYLPKSIYPGEATKEILTRVKADTERLQSSIDTNGIDSPETKEIARGISQYWNTAPGEKETIPEPKISIDPATGEKGKWVASQIEELFRALPNSGRAVAEVFIIPRDAWPDWKDTMGMITHKDKGAYIWILEPPPVNYLGEEREWTREELFSNFAHDFLGHAMSLRGEGYILRFLTPAEVVDLLHGETVLWDRHYRPSGEGKAVAGGGEEEANADFASDFFMGSETEFEYMNPEIIKDFETHFNNVYSKILGYPITLDELAYRLKLR